MLAEATHGKRKVRGKMQADLCRSPDAFLRVASDQICVQNLLVFKSGFV